MFAGAPICPLPIEESQTRNLKFMGAKSGAPRKIMPGITDMAKLLPQPWKGTWNYTFIEFIEISNKSPGAVPKYTLVTSDHTLGEKQTVEQVMQFKRELGIAPESFFIVS